jgi:multiple sugar transport system substrate-binding protein
MTNEKKISRRNFAKTAATGIVGLAVGAGIGYGAASMAKPPAAPGGTTTVTSTVTKTAAAMGTDFPFNLPREGATIRERAVNAAKFVLEQHPEWKGEELVLACVGGYEHGFIAMKKFWEEATDIPVTVVTTPLPDFFDKMMMEAVSKTGDVDLLNAQAMYFCDLAEAGLLAELDDFAMWIDIREHGRPDGYIYPLNYSIPRYAGKLYGFLQDGDVQTLYYRQDWLEDPQEKTAFERENGYPLDVPITMTEYNDMCRFFTRPDDDVWGDSSGRELSRNCFTYYLFVAGTKWPNWYYFDDSMNAQLTSDEAIMAGEMFLENTTYGHPSLPELSGQAPYSIFAEGRAAFILSAPSTSRVIQDPAAASRNNWNTAPIPGHWVDGPDGKILNRRSVNLASWSLCVSNYSKKKDLAMCAGAFFSDGDMLVEAMCAAGTWHDPTRYTHVGPNAPEKLKDLRGPVLNAFLDNAEIMQPMLQGILGATEYNTTLSKTLHGAMLGSYDNVTALEDANKTWNEITDRMGKAKQLTAWRELKKFYPTISI